MVQLLVGYEFPFDTNRALELALFHTFSSPRISVLLHKSGQFEKHGQKRYDDTSLLISRFMEDGLDSEKGQRAIGQINRIHGKFDIANEDFIFVLSTFMTYPVRWINRFGWRKLTPDEELAFFFFFREAGKQMQIRDIPETPRELEEFIKQYEAANMKYEESNRKIADATVRIVKNWFPVFLRSLVKPSFTALIDDKLRTSFGYRRPGFLFRAILTGLLQLRKWPLKLVTFKPYPTLIENTRYRHYPAGIPEIEKTGPEWIQKLK